MANNVAVFKSVAERILSHPTWDVLLVFALLGAGFFYGISAGKRRIAATLLYTYAAYTVSAALPLEKWFSALPGLNPFFIRAGSFLVAFFFLALFLGAKKSRSFAPAGAWWQIFLLSLLQAGLIIHILLQFLPLEKVKLLAPLTKNVFVNPNWHFWWLFVPLLFLIFLKKFESSDP